MNKSPLYHPRGEFIENDTALDQFLQFILSQKIELYPAQEEAILELFNGNNVILNTPTGSGKSLVAIASHYYFGFSFVVALLVSKQPPWSIATSTRTVPGIILSNIFLVISFGALDPGINTVPIIK